MWRGKECAGIFYATDVDPIEIAKEFSGWSDKSQIYAADHYGYAFEKEMKNDALFETACKGIFKVRAQNDEVSAGVCYVKKPQVFYERYSLKPDKKRYLIYVDANDYNIIRSLSR